MCYVYVFTCIFSARAHAQVTTPTAKPAGQAVTHSKSLKNFRRAACWKGNCTLALESGPLPTRLARSRPLSPAGQAHITLI